MRRVAAALLMGLASVVLAPVGGASAAPAARLATCDGTIDPARWDGPSTAAIEYGEGWSFVAYSNGTYPADGPWSGVGSVSGAGGYAPGSYPSWDSANCQLYLTITTSPTDRPLPVGTYKVSADISNDPGTEHYVIDPPATLTVTPAALTVALKIVPDPSNLANAIISAELTGNFRQNFFTAAYAQGPLPPAGTWHLEVTDEDGEVVHDASIDRTESEDIMGASSYWPDVPPGTYTVRGTFTTSGSGASNFAITNPSPLTFTADPAPGATSTATPAPPAPPPAEGDTGLTLPAWIPLLAGVMSAGLLALLIVQVVRLRRAGAPAAAAEGTAS